MVQINLKSKIYNDVLNMLSRFQVYLVQDRKPCGAPVGHLCLHRVSCSAHSVSLFIYEWATIVLLIQIFCRLAVFAMAMMISIAGQPQKRMSSPSSVITQVKSQNIPTMWLSGLLKSFYFRPPLETPLSASYTTQSRPPWRSTRASTS